MQSSALMFSCPHCQHKNEYERVSKGEVVTCAEPLCGKEFRATLPEAEPEPRVIDPTEATDSARESQGDEVVDESKQVFSHEADDEPVFESFETPTISRFPFRFLGHLALILLGCAVLVLALMNASLSVAILGMVPLLAGLGLLGYWRWQASGKTLSLTRQSLVYTDKRDTDKTVEIHLENITDIHIYQSWPSNLFDTGALLVEWGREDSEKLYFDAVGEPHRLVKRIRELAGQ